MSIGSIFNHPLQEIQDFTSGSHSQKSTKQVTKIVDGDLKKDFYWYEIRIAFIAAIVAVVMNSIYLYVLENYQDLKDDGDIVVNLETNRLEGTFGNVMLIMSIVSVVLVGLTLLVAFFNYRKISGYVDSELFVLIGVTFIFSMVVSVLNVVLVENFDSTKETVQHRRLRGSKGRSYIGLNSVNIGLLVVALGATYSHLKYGS